MDIETTKLAVQAHLAEYTALRQELILIFAAISLVSTAMLRDYTNRDPGD